MSANLDMFGFQASNEADQLASRLTECNRLYRAGTPAVSDAEYDLLTERLRQIAPDHPMLHSVEPEPMLGAGKVRHPAPMLSTEKAYSDTEIARFVQRIHAAAAELGIPAGEVYFRITPKLDGLAGRDDGQVLATRGNGDEGSDITRAFDRGLVAVGGRGQGVGEIIVHQPYFDEYLADAFEHPRNFAVGAISADTLTDEAQHAYAHGALRFVPYTEVPAWEGVGDELVARLREIENEVKSAVEYAMDGLVIETTHPAIKTHLGHTSHHYRWMIALKAVTETATSTVRSIAWQTARTGRITPVLEIEPTRLSGATISRVTAHHAGIVRAKALGPGSRIEIVRSGEVIPKIVEVLSASGEHNVPAACPCCGTPTVWEGDFLKCPNTTDCSAQTVTGLVHFFKTLGNVDLMGPRTIERLVEGGFTTLPALYALTVEQLQGLGFGPGQSANIVAELERSRTETVDDFRFLAAFGIEDLGRGDSRRLLQHIALEHLPALTTEQLQAIHGFGTKTSPIIVERLQKRWPTIAALLALGFNFRRTARQAETVSTGPLTGKNVVFTGSMQSGGRSQMEDQARLLGANVQSSVRKTTHLLVCGANVGASKTEKAAKCGTKVISEAEYLAMIV